MKRVDIFISSAERELENEREIAAEVVNSMNLQPMLFELYPALSNSPFDAYVEEVQRSDIFVLILWKSLRQAVKSEYEKAVEKNKPILIFIKNIEFGESREKELEDFMSQFKDGGLAPKIRISTWRNFRSLKEFREVLKASISIEISKFYKEPTHTLSKEEMYDLGTSIISQSQKRIYLYQRTPTLILGTKDRIKQNSYSTGSYQSYEMRFQNALEKWIEEHYKLPDVEFSYLYNAEQSLKELTDSVPDENREQKVEEIKQQLLKYKKIEEETNYRFRFMPLETPVSGPFVIGDNRYAIWILGADDAISFSQDDEKIASILVRMIKSHTQKIKPFEELMKQLTF